MNITASSFKTVVRTRHLGASMRKRCRLLSLDQQQQSTSVRFGHWQRTHTQYALSHATQRHSFFPITQTPCSSCTEPAQSVLSLSKLLFRTFIFPSLKWLDVAVEQKGYFPQGQCDFSLITNQQKKPARTWLSTQQPNVPPNMNSRLPGSCISAMQRRLCCLSTSTCTTKSDVKVVY